MSVRAASAAVTVPTAVLLFTVWLLHSRHHKRGTAQQLVLPVASLLVLACTFGSGSAVLPAGVVSALTVAAGIVLARRGVPENV